jgi:tripartite-type tricarboxylate transporter receptor subunit TctC
MPKRQRRTVLFALATFAAALTHQATAQTTPPTSTQTSPTAAYPTRPVTLVIPFPAGGATDVLGRTLATKLGAALGQTVVVENRTGAGGTVGAATVAKAASDGYTLLMATSSTHSIGPAINPKIPYDAFKDFAPIAQVATAANVLLVSTTVPVTTAKAFADLLKANPGKYNFGSSGIGTIPHLTAELFKAQAGNVFAVHIPYRGTGLVIPDLMAGQVHFLMDSLVTAAPLVRDGKLRALAVTGAQRGSTLPDVPTFTEAGIPGMDASTWFGLFAPAGTDIAIVRRISDLMGQIVRSPDVTAQLTKLGADPVASTPEQFAQRVRGDFEQWSAMIKRANIKLEP